MSSNESERSESNGADSVDGKIRWMQQKNYVEHSRPFKGDIESLLEV